MREREKEKREQARQKNGSVARLAAAVLRQLPKKSQYIYKHTAYIRLVPKTATRCGAALQGEAYRSGGEGRDQNQAKKSM